MDPPNNTPASQPARASTANGNGQSNGNGYPPGYTNGNFTGTGTARRHSRDRGHPGIQLRGGCPAPPGDGLWSSPPGAQ
nr:hypothetical protein B0A51_05594 [Rachicladosporium sp. CCFEE 5018]